VRTVTVFGASGRQGLAQVRQLVRAGFRVRAVSRRSDPLLGETWPEVEVVAADLDDVASLRAVMAGADAVFFTRPLIQFADPVARVRRLAEAAKAERVGLVVMNTSLGTSDAPTGDAAYDSTKAQEDALAESGAPYVIVRPVLFMDNLLTNWALPSIVNEGAYVYPHRRDLAANWISLDDVARYMIAVLDRPDLLGRRIALGGPEQLVPPQVAEVLSGALGRPIVYRQSRPADFGPALAEAFGDAIPPEHRAAVADRFTEFYTFTNRAPHKPFEVDTAALDALIPLQTETLAQWARRQDWSLGGRRPPAG
jgi:uncharacterized protein YbjT (DUF2867 family)